MSNQFEKILSYVINEEMDKAYELFHDHTIRLSRKMYEDALNDEDFDFDQVSDDEVNDYEDDISGDEEGMSNLELDDEGEEFDLDNDSSVDEDGDIEDRVVDLEAAIDELNAKFQEISDMEDDDMEVDSEDEEFNFEDEGLEDDSDEDDSDEGDSEEVDLDEEDESESDEDDDMEDVDELEKEMNDMVREYIEKVPAPNHKAAAGKSPVAGKNPMGANGANASNILRKDGKVEPKKPTVGSMGVRGKWGQETGGKLKPAPKPKNS